MGPKKALLTEQEKRNNHIQSEQKRRDAIRNGFADLVSLLTQVRPGRSPLCVAMIQTLPQGEAVSGLSIAAGAEDEAGRKGRGRGRGRGRKGDASGGAAKSVILTQACRYVAWLESGNQALQAEIARLEGLTGQVMV
jgi:hypothetical protein